MSDAFELLREETVPEINSEVRLYRHIKTGGEVMSITNQDENKVFGITFKTPPEDSTGIAHILEHSVLCGSRKYQVKKPFVELIKGSLHTFLNAMTYPDKTAYPVASQNLKDFYNLVDVYLDATLFPLISEDTFRQEGWHYELDAADAPLVYKGVVFNEMKGVFSSPDSVLYDAAQRSLYPDVTYGLSSGGDPKVIPQLSYEQFKAFHRKYYHPSNARAFFAGDDDPAKRLELLDQYYSQFERVPVTAQIGLQPRFNAPRQVTATYAATPNEGEKARDGMVAVNWMLDPAADRTATLANSFLSYILAGTSASPLRKALTDSGIGEGMTGGGISGGLRQPMATFGLKGIDPADAPKVEALILDTLKDLADNGIDRETIDAALNTFEFSLREANTGSSPRGMSLMFQALSTWLHDGDPLAPLSFEAPLAAIKAQANSGLFEGLIRTHFLDNPHRTTVTLSADPTLEDREKAEEVAQLAAVRAKMTPEDLAAVAESTRKLKALQDAVDAPEDLAKIPSLALGDLDRDIRTIPNEIGSIGGVRSYFHDLPTSGIFYFDAGFDLHAIETELLPYLPLFGRALLQTGTKNDDFVTLTQRIGRTTGGVGQHRNISGMQGSDATAAWMFLSGKAVPDRIDDLLSIFTDVLLTARLDNRARFKQMALEEKSGYEARLVPGGNGIVDTRLRAGLLEANWIGEMLGGITYLEFVRTLVKRIETDWEGVQAALERIRTALISRAHMVVNVTTEGHIWRAAEPQVARFLAGLPAGNSVLHDWGFAGAPRSEGLVIPAQVNYVGKGANLKALGFNPSGATSVAIKHLNTTWLWDKVRVQGGAYGGSSRFDVNSGIFSFLSYRDPNLLKTLEAYDGSSAALRGAIGEQELTRSIIGVIGDIDQPMFPDAKGFAAMFRHLTGITDELRQQRRDEVLGAGPADFRALADALDLLKDNGHVVVLGSEAAIAAANAERGNFLAVTKVL